MTDSRASTNRDRSLTLPDLTIARGDLRTLRTVVGRYLKTMLRSFLSIPHASIHARIRPLYAAAAQQIKATAKADMGAALAMLRLPTHNALIALCTREHPTAVDRAAMSGWLQELSLLVLLQECLAGRLTRTISWRLAPGQRLVSIPANLCITAHGPTELRLSPDGIALDGIALDGIALDGVSPGVQKDRKNRLSAPQDASWSVSEPYHTIVPGIALALVDNNPLSDFEAHPDKQGNQLDLGGRTSEQWCDVLRGCFGLIDRYLPLLGQELRMVGVQIIPVGYDSEKHLSASYKEAIGTVYMTLHPNLMTMTEALIHELQHNKLNAACHLDPLLHNALSPLFASPVRPDPRPLHGVLLAVHAFQPVACLYRAMLAQGDELAADQSWRRRFGQIIGKNHDGATTILTHGQPTDAGTGLLAEMRALDHEFAQLDPGAPS